MELLFTFFLKFIMFLERASFESNKFTIQKPLKCIFYNCVRYYYLYHRKSVYIN